MGQPLCQGQQAIFCYIYLLAGILIYLLRVPQMAVV